MAHKWREAADKYRAYAITSTREAVITRVAADLERFLASEDGAAAKDLLAESKRTIILARQSGNGEDLIILDHQGFKKVHRFCDGDHLMGSTPDVISPIDGRGVAETLLLFGDRRHLGEINALPHIVKALSHRGEELRLPGCVIAGLRDELDEIAKQAPQL